MSDTTQPTMFDLLESIAAALWCIQEELEVLNGSRCADCGEPVDGGQEPSGEAN